MKKFKLKSLICMLLAVAMVMSLPIMGSIFAETTTGLNGASCDLSDFDESVYAGQTHIAYIQTFNWPSSGNVLITTGGKYTLSDMNGVTIPAGLVVDVYNYSGRTYTFLARYDTTNGKSYTVGSSSSNTGNTSSTGTSSTSTSSTSTTKLWGTVKKVFTPYPSVVYTHSYDDVSPDAWYYDAVMTLTEGGLVSGYGNGKFGPEDPITHAQLNIVLANLYGTGLNPSDVADTAVSTRAFAAVSYIGGLDTVGTVTLTDHELSLVRNAGGMIAGMSTSGRIGSMYRPIYDNWRAGLDAGKSTNYISSIDDLPDGDVIHQWINENISALRTALFSRNWTDQNIIDECEKDIVLAYNLGMFNGVDAQGTFDPYGTLTRGQLCQILYSMGWTDKGILNYYK